MLHVFTADLLHYVADESLAAGETGSLALHSMWLLHLESLTTVVSPMITGITLHC